MASIPPVRQLKGRTLGRILIKMGILTRDKVHRCLKLQEKKSGKVKIGEIFLEEGLVKKKDLNIALAAQRGMEYIDLSGLDIRSDVLSQVPAQTARTYKIIPLEFDKSRTI